MNGADQTENVLRIALQTMKERCLALQHRLSSVEDENQQLHERLEINAQNAPQPASGNDTTTEILQLRLQTAELQRQKTQLNEHINMVSSENKKLWSRLSQMTKEQDKGNTPFDGNVTLTNAGEQGIGGSPRSNNLAGSNGSANQNLIRSKTFTQHSPNPHLRHKLISSEVEEELKNMSLEEVDLDVFDENTGAKPDITAGTDTELGFAYLNIDQTTNASGSNSEMDFNQEAKRCIEGIQDLRREAMLQQKELNTAFMLIEKRLACQPCPECVQKSQKPEMADKSLETDDSLNEVKFQSKYEPFQTFPAETPDNNPVVPSNTHINIIQEKLDADAMDKTCPMCGKSFNSAASYTAFRQHVELHFIDDSNDVEGSMDRNFEFVSHTVGDF